MNILLVDDSRLIRTINERTLMKAGHTVIVASDGEEALRLATERKPDLIILDMLLPKISGVDVLRALRKNICTASIPVMVVSSLPESNREKLISEGATAYFEKSLFAAENGPQAFLEAVQPLIDRIAKQTPHLSPDNPKLNPKFV